jgi:hypothetical protein
MTKVLLFQNNHVLLVGDTHLPVVTFDDVNYKTTSSSFSPDPVFPRHTFPKDVRRR